jgi:uncharacterized protein (TIGR03000 family)
MFRTTHTLSCVLVLSMVAVFMTPSLGQAQRGGRGGGGHYGGASVGGYRGGAYRGPAYYGGNRYPNARYGYGPYYRSYGYSPYFYGVPDYDLGVSPPYYPDATNETTASGSYQALYPPPAVLPPLDTSAQIGVMVPAGAEIWFDGTLTTSTGTVRRFHSPPLTPGNHSYEIRARWSEDGREVTQTQRVEVAPGAHVNVSFPIPSTALGQAVKKG